MSEIECLVEFRAIPKLDIEGVKARIVEQNAMKTIPEIYRKYWDIRFYLDGVATHKKEFSLALPRKEYLQSALKKEFFEFAKHCGQREFFYAYVFTDCTNQKKWEYVNVVHILANESFERYKDVYKNLAGVVDDLSDNL